MGFFHKLLLNKSSDGGFSNDIRQFVRKHFRLRIKNIAFYEEAMRHSSVLDGDTSGKRSNERLEFLGDAVLDLTVAAYLYRKDDQAQEGLLTQRKSKIVSRKSLNLIGKTIGLEVLLDVKMRREDIRPTMVGNALEALIGAVYLDHGFSRTNQSLIKLLQRYGLDDKVHETTDFKSQLYHWAQKSRASLSFQVLRELPDEGYEVEVLIDGKRIGTGKGRSKKIAEKEAARMGWRKVFDLEEAKKK